MTSVLSRWIDNDKVARNDFNVSALLVAAAKRC